MTSSQSFWIIDFKNTVRGGGSTALYAAYTVDTDDMANTVDMIYTVDMI